MRCSVLQDQFLKALLRVKAAVEDEPQVEILGNVLLKAEYGRMMIAATNLEISIITFIGCQTDQEGAITLPYNRLLELVSLLPPERVDLKLDIALQKLEIRCGASKNNIKGTAAYEYPVLEEKHVKDDVVLPAGTFREMVSRISYAAGGKSGLPVYSGVHLATDGDTLRFEATNGYRLAVDSVEACIDKPLDVIVPKEVFKIAARIADKDDQEIHISCIDTKIYFQIGTTQVIGQTLEGVFPDIQRIIPQNFLTSLRVCREELLRALRRAEIFAKDKDYYCTIVASDVLVDVSTQGSERGDLIGSLSTELEGESLTVGANIKYMQQALNAISSEWVTVSGSGPKAPIVIRPEDESGIHFIASMSLR